MKIIDADQAPRLGSSEHRPGGIAFTGLLDGDEFDLGNFSLSLVHVADHYHAPRHRHNFEQVRVMLDGQFGFGPGQTQTAGSIGYFCEGTYYTQHGEGPSTTLLLQLAGSSGDGYMSQRQLREGIEALRLRGEFANGVFTWLDSEQKKHNQDGYEAVWEHVMGRPLRYALPRYLAPILIEPDRFAFVDDGLGLAVRHLGTFGDGRLSLQQVRVQPHGTVKLPSIGQRCLGWVQRGCAQAVGAGHLGARHAFDLPAGGELMLVCGEKPLEMLIFLLPRVAPGGLGKSSGLKECEVVRVGQSPPSPSVSLQGKTERGRLDSKNLAPHRTMDLRY